MPYRAPYPQSPYRLNALPLKPSWSGVSNAWYPDCIRTQLMDNVYPQLKVFSLQAEFWPLRFWFPCMALQLGLWCGRLGMWRRGWLAALGEGGGERRRKRERTRRMRMRTMRMRRTRKGRGRKRRRGEGGRGGTERGPAAAAAARRTSDRPCSASPHPRAHAPSAPCASPSPHSALLPRPRPPAPLAPWPQGTPRATSEECTPGQCPLALASCLLPGHPTSTQW